MRFAICSPYWLVYVRLLSGQPESHISQHFGYPHAHKLEYIHFAAIKIEFMSMALCVCEQVKWNFLGTSHTRRRHSSMCRQCYIVRTRAYIYCLTISSFTVKMVKKEKITAYLGNMLNTCMYLTYATTAGMVHLRMKNIWRPPAFDFQNRKEKQKFKSIDTCCEANTFISSAHIQSSHRHQRRNTVRAIVLLFTLWLMWLEKFNICVVR